MEEKESESLVEYERKFTAAVERYSSRNNLHWTTERLKVQLMINEAILKQLGIENIAIEMLISGEVK